MQESQNYIQTINNWINSNTTFLNSVPPEILNQLKFLVSSEIKQAEERVIRDIMDMILTLNINDGRLNKIVQQDVKPAIITGIEYYAKEHSIELIKSRGYEVFKKM